MTADSMDEFDLAGRYVIWRRCRGSGARGNEEEAVCWPWVDHGDGRGQALISLEGIVFSWERGFPSQRVMAILGLG